jgi:hypothetical protein
LDRVDALVIDVNTTPEVRWNEIKWVEGVPASRNPERPTLLDEEFHKQYPLCYVYRAAGTTIIGQENITNMVGTSEFPFVTGIIDSIDTDALLAQWQNDFVRWNAAKRVEFEVWFEHLHDELDENQASHLQNQIDNQLDGHLIRTMSISEHEQIGSGMPYGTLCFCYADGN